MDRYDGFWISPDNALLAFEQVDERDVVQYTIPHYVDDPTAKEDHRYPFAGAANPKVRLGVVQIGGVSVSDKRVVWLDLFESGADSELYLARVEWKDRTRLYVQTLDRHQQELRLFLMDAETGRSELLLKNISPTSWVNLRASLAT